MLSVPTLKILIHLTFTRMRGSAVGYAVLEANAKVNYRKKLNSLKHLVRTTVAESHSKYEKSAIT